MCKEEERNSSLVQEEPQPLQIKDEQQEQLLQRPEEAAGSTLTSLAVKREDDENRDTEPLASTSTEHMKTQASQPTSDDQLLSSHRSESDTEDSDDWEETREDQSASNKLNSKPFQDLRSSTQTPSTRARKGNTAENPFTCKVCRKWFGSSHALDVHMGRGIHTGDSTCTECGKVFGYPSDLKHHMETHTCEKPFACPLCSNRYGSGRALDAHVRTHAAEKTLYLHRVWQRVRSAG